MKKRVAMALACASLLSGCLSFRGPEGVYGTRGVVGSDIYGNRNGPLFERFRNAATLAAGCGLRPDHPARDNRGDPRIQCETGIGREVTAADIQAFQLAGYALIYADCTNYFAVMGRAQGRSRILRDTIAPISSLLTGLLTLKDFGDSADAEEDILTAISLATGTAASGLDIFDQNFLFGANNIDAVRQLITRTLSIHATATSRSDAPETFEDAVINILDHQAICRPSAIMTYTREAIAAGRVEPIRADDNDVLPIEDTTPAAFSFADRIDAPLATVVESDQLQLSGIGGPARILVEGGEYQIRDGGWTNSPGTIIAGAPFRVRTTSSDQYSTDTAVSVDIGGVADTFTVTTIADPNAAPNETAEAEGVEGSAEIESLEAIPPPAQAEGSASAAPRATTTLSIPERD